MKETFLWLPEEVIHHIWSYLKAEKQAQTSAISKNWLNAWRSNPRLNFDDCYFNEDQERFQHYVNATLARFKGLNIKELNLSMAMTPDDDDFSTSVDRWLYFATKKGLQVLQLTLPDLSIHFSYNLPSNILGIESLTTLRVTRCKFPDPNDVTTLISCKNLRVLHLISVYNLNNEMFNRLILACPLINDLKISDHYDELDNIKVFNLTSLKQLCIEEGYASETRMIEVMNVPSLETMVVKLEYGQCRLTLHAAPNLKSLSIKNGNLKDDFFETLKDKFPRLECLELKGCYGFKEKNLLPSHGHKLKICVSEFWDD